MQQQLAKHDFQFGTVFISNITTFSPLRSATRRARRVPTQATLLEALTPALESFTPSTPLTVYLKLGYDKDGKNKLDDEEYLKHAFQSSPFIGMGR